MYLMAKPLITKEKEKPMDSQPITIGFIRSSIRNPSVYSLSSLVKDGFLKRISII